MIHNWKTISYNKVIYDKSWIVNISVAYNISNCYQVGLSTDESEKQEAKLSLG